MSHPTEKGIDPPQTLDVSHWDKYWLKWFKRLADAFPKVETYSKALTPASVAANTTAEQTFIVNGLVTSDILTVNKPSLDAGIGIVNVRVTSINTMAITYSNNTGGAIVPTLLSLDQIEKVEGKMLDMPQVECPVTHHFGAGIYIREVRIPAGTFSIGHHQNFEHMNHMVEGRVIMLNDDRTTTEVVAGATFISPAGRKVGFILEDMIWRNIYPTNETDIDKLEETYLTKSDTWVDNDQSKFDEAYLMRHEDREDFKKMLEDLDVSRGTVLSQSENESDQIPMPSGSYNISVSKSNIEGKGVFATSLIRANEIIAPARVNGKRTPVGRYTNHSLSPNAKMMAVNNDIYLVANREIKGCFGGESGDEITIDYRQAVELTISTGVLCQE
jgi:hypothetical protein